jgi:hypothetical protein
LCKELSIMSQQLDFLQMNGVLFSCRESQCYYSEAFTIFQLIQNSELFYVTLKQATALYRVLILSGVHGGPVG